MAAGNLGNSRLEALAALPASFPVPASARYAYVQLGANFQPQLPMDSRWFGLINDALPVVMSRLVEDVGKRSDLALIYRAIANQSGEVVFHITHNLGLGATLTPVKEVPVPSRMCVKSVSGLIN
eukprot:7263400-Prymnesium_polylepis.3